MSFNELITKGNLDSFLKELASEFRRRNGKTTPAEIILIGGASVLLNYEFRQLTYDIDAIINAPSLMKDSINTVGDKLELPTGWLNADFVRTKSYTPHLNEFSVYYKTFSNVLEIRTVTGEYLIAMKLMSGRQYKNDLSDVAGILLEQERRRSPISIDKIGKAVNDLYGGWKDIPSSSRKLLDDIAANPDYEKLYQQCRDAEDAAKSDLEKFEETYPGVAKAENVNEILNKLKSKSREER